MNLKEIEPGLSEKLKYNEAGLIPAIIQEEDSGKVLMLAYMNRESLELTLQTGKTCFFSRSRQKLWTKGETSGNYQEVQGVYYDCDKDALLIKVFQQGNACHTGSYSCFSNLAAASRDYTEKCKENGIVEELYQLLQDRNEKRPEGSYTTYLFTEGQDKILKKVGEEATEVVIGSKNHSPKEIRYEMADLMYHCLVLLVYHDMKPREILEELAKRR